MSQSVSQCMKYISGIDKSGSVCGTEVFPLMVVLLFFF